MEQPSERVTPSEPQLSNTARRKQEGKRPRGHRSEAAKRRRNSDHRFAEMGRDVEMSTRKAATSEARAKSEVKVCQHLEARLCEAKAELRTQQDLVRERERQAIAARRWAIERVHGEEGEILDAKARLISHCVHMRDQGALAEEICTAHDEHQAQIEVKIALDKFIREWTAFTIRKGIRKAMAADVALQQRIALERRKSAMASLERHKSAMAPDLFGVW